MVIAETGAATAVAKALPELAGKLTGRSIRVPVPTVSLAILNLSLATPTDRDRLNRHLQATCLHCDLRRQTAYTDSPEVVSSDFLGTRHTGIVDGLATIAHGTNAVVYVWYDNEYGYSRQVIRVMDHLAGTQRPALPTTSHIPTASFIGGKLSDRTGRRKVFVITAASHYRLAMFVIATADTFDGFLVGTAISAPASASTPPSTSPSSSTCCPTTATPPRTSACSTSPAPFPSPWRPRSRPL